MQRLDAVDEVLILLIYAPITFRQRRQISIHVYIVSEYYRAKTPCV